MPSAWHNLNLVTNQPVLLTGLARENRFDSERTRCLEDDPGGYGQGLQAYKEGEMKKRKPTAGQRMIESARQALAFAKGMENHGCEVHVPDDIDVKPIREKISLSQGSSPSCSV